MPSFARSLTAAFTVFIGVGPALAVDVIAPLRTQPAPVGVLFKPTNTAVAIRVVDERAEKNLIGGGVLGPWGETGSGPYLIYATKKSDEIAAHFASSAEAGVKVLGFGTGQGGLTLEIAIREFWIDMYRMSGFSPMNCIAYGTLRTQLTGGQMPEPRVNDLRVTFWETTNPVGSMKEVAKEAVSRIYAQSAWKAVASALLEEREMQPDEAQFVRVLELIRSPKDDLPARQAIFWLALAQQATPAVEEALMTILSQSKEQRLHEAAAEALGMLGVAEAKARMIAILQGQKAGGWDNTDSEQVWYLLRGLALLGESDLLAKIPSKPRSELRPMSKIEDLVAFHSGGSPPAMTGETRKKLAKAKAKLEKKVEK